MNWIVLLAAAVLTLGLTACSTCYECTYDVEIIDDTTGDVTYEPVTEEVCTSDSEEIDAREAEGEVCALSSNS